MTAAPEQSPTQAETRIERFDPWISWTLTILLHILFVLALLHSTKPFLTPPQGSSSGGRVKVDMLGQAPPDAQPVPSPPPESKAKPEQTRTRRRPRTTPATPPVQTTLVLEGEAPLIADTPEPDPDQPQPPAPRPEDAASQRRAQAPAASTPNPAWRRSATWGLPPGMQADNPTPGPSRGSSNTQSRANDASGTPTMEVGGYQIYYDLIAEPRLRGWKEQGMTELSFPLPGMRQYMVCPLEIVLRRGSGGCRLSEPNDPEMKKVGDARDVVAVMRVYRQGELVWSGPGAYR